MFDSSIDDEIESFGTNPYQLVVKCLPLKPNQLYLKGENGAPRRPTYAPGWRILEDGIEVFKATSNEGDGYSRNPATYTYTLERDSSTTLSIPS